MNPIQFGSVLLLALVACQGDDPQPEPRDPEAPVVTGDPAPSFASSSTVRLAIEGMLCETCADMARSCLEEIAGVNLVDVRFEDDAATVGYDREQVTEDLIVALNGVDRGQARPLRQASSPPRAWKIQGRERIVLRIETTT